MEKVFNLLDYIAPLESGLREYLEKNLKKREKPKDAILLQEGAIAQTIGFIDKGLIRGFRTGKNDVERTTWFMKEGDIFISIRSFFKQLPARETIQTIEPCVFYTLTFQELREAYSKYPSFHRHRAELLEKYYLLSEEREDLRQQDETADRIRFLLEHYPDLVHRVPDKLLASFVDTTPQYFSSLKGRYKKP